MIELTKVSFSYHSDAPPALREVSLTIPVGQWLAVIGANGSGKSTMARCLNGLLLPQSGTVTVDGFCTALEAELPRVRERVAFVFQNPDNQFVATSIEDDVAFGPENLGLPRDEITRRVNAALEVVDLTAQRDKAPHLLSGGQKQRAAIAGALAMAAQYLVLDEPTAMLDPLLREQIFNTLKKLHRERGMGVIYVTNIMEEALAAERVVVLDNGCVARDGSPREIFGDHQWLLDHGLDVPQICRIASMLANDGYEWLRGMLTADELVEKLCK